MIQKLLNGNTALLDLINTSFILPTQNKIDFIKSVGYEKENIKIKISKSKFK